MKIEGSIQELELFFKKFTLVEKVPKEITLNGTKIGEQVLEKLKEYNKNPNIQERR